MAHAHFGNLADVFKHLALAEILGTLRPGEYWESHAGAALNLESQNPPPPDRLHGIHTFLRLATENDALRSSIYHRLLAYIMTLHPANAGRRTFPGSPMLARLLMPETARRLLFCDTDDDALASLKTPLLSSTPGSPAPREAPFKDIIPEKIECVRDDGISVLRGAGILLPEPWTRSTLTFLDPPELDAPTDAGISSLDLACELATRNIPILLWYGFRTEPHRAQRHALIKAALDKSRLKATRLEGSLASPDTPTQYGFALLALNLPPEPLARAILKLKALEAAYLPTPAPWKLTQTAL